MDFLIVAFAAFFVSGLTLFSGFGLGTLLLPVFALFFPVEVAVAAVAVVHGINNLFKIFVVGRHADRSLVLRFGLPAVFAAFVGASALGYVSQFEAIIRYSVGSKTAVITPVKLAVGFLMLVFAWIELSPKFRKLTFKRQHLVAGGVLSGFFGGFSGHQGALRSAFLVKADIATEAFVGTNAFIGFMVDAARIATYIFIFLATGMGTAIGSDRWPLILTGILGAFGGVMTGKRFLHKVTMKSIQTLTGILLLGIALALGLGLI
ncbi:MAG: sulfite exporter TauE/SafE family protein [Desulfobacterales bacterium]